MKNKYDFSKARKGKRADEVKVSKTFRLDADVLEWLEEQGEKEGMGYQTFFELVPSQSNALTILY